MTAVLAPPDSHPISRQSCLTGRAQPRDFVDVAALVERFGFEGLCRLAAERCAGSGPRRLRGAHERGNAVDGRGDIFAAGAQADTEVAGHTEAVPRC
jgi:hypothetical protein